MPVPPNGSEISLTIPKPTASSTITTSMISRMPRTFRYQGAFCGGATSPMSRSMKQLAARRRRLAEPGDGLLEVVGPALGERERRVGHAAQLHALLRARGRDRAAEVRARRVGVVALGGAGAEDRLRGRLELLLALELLVGALLELLHRGERGALLDLDLSRLGRHRAPERSARRPRRFGHGASAVTLARMRVHLGAAMVVMALALAVAAPAGAQQAPTLGAPPTPSVTAQPVQSTTGAGNGGLKTWQEVLIFAAGIILIGGIAVAILTDSRERAAKIRHGGPITDPGDAPHRHKQRSKQQARAKAKAAKAARRRNR